jgi:hypothetical protein
MKKVNNMRYDINLVKKYIHIPKDNESMNEDIKNIVNELEPFVNLKHYYQIFDLKHNPLSIKDINLNSKILDNYFKDSNKVIILVCTLGIIVEKYLKKMEITDKSKLFIADAILSSIIETYQDDIIVKLAEDYPDCFLTSGFAPGYPDLDISFQKEIFRLLQIPKRLGINLTEDYLMIPRKSSTALVGISKKKVIDQLACLNCNLKDDCEIRRNGGHCGK